MLNASRKEILTLYTLLFKISYLIRLEKGHPKHRGIAILIAAIAIYYTAQRLRQLL
jgi:hypothetical protein